MTLDNPSKLELETPAKLTLTSKVETCCYVGRLKDLKLLGVNRDLTRKANLKNNASVDKGCCKT
jgi:hypothetical protein